VNERAGVHSTCEPPGTLIMLLAVFAWVRSDEQMLRRLGGSGGPSKTEMLAIRAQSSIGTPGLRKVMTTCRALDCWAIASEREFMVSSWCSCFAATSSRFASRRHRRLDCIFLAPKRACDSRRVGMAAIEGAAADQMCGSLAGRFAAAPPKSAAVRAMASGSQHGP